MARPHWECFTPAPLSKTFQKRRAQKDQAAAALTRTLCSNWKTTWQAAGTKVTNSRSNGADIPSGMAIGFVLGEETPVLIPMHLGKSILFRQVSAVACCVTLILALQVHRSAEGQSASAPDQKRSPVRPLSPEQKARFESGKELYAVICGACHQPHGNGQEGLAPPLANSEWTTGSEGRLIRVALQGVRGPIKVNGKVFELEMPAMLILEDEQIAAVLTYIRREWGNTAAPIEPKTVAKIRAETAKRDEAWTEAELLKIP